MSESKSAKLIWLLAGAIVGSAVSLSFDEWIEPFFEAKADFRIVAERTKPGTANFMIQNVGEAAASDVTITLWAIAPFSERTDIVNVEHTGGAADADCTVGFYEARLTGRGKSAVPSALDTKSKALRVECKTIRSQEAWQGRLQYQGPEAVLGLWALVKDPSTSENKYARFRRGAPMTPNKVLQPRAMRYAACPWHHSPVRKALQRDHRKVRGS